MATYNPKLEISAQQVQEILADHFKNQGLNVIELKFNLNSGGGYPDMGPSVRGITLTLEMTSK